MVGGWSRLSRRGVVRGIAALVFVLCAVAAAWPEPAPLQQAFVLALLLCLTAALLCASARPAFALLAGGGAFLALRELSNLKLRYLDSPLMPADFLYYASSSLLDTLRHYPHLYLLGIAVLLSVPLLLVLAWRLDRPLFTARRGWRGAGLRFGATALCVLAFRLCLLPAGPFAELHQRNAWEKLSDDAQLTNFFVNLNDSDVSLPVMADAAAAEHAFGDTAAGLPGTRPPPYPDIVQVLEESTFDPAIFTACNVPACQAAMFRPDTRTRGHGLLRTHTFGGGTWVSEFAVHTGLPQDVFGPGGMYAPFVLAPHMRDTLPDLLRRLGYLTVAIFPTSGDFLNGRNAYAAYGFDRVFDARDLGLEEWEETDAQMFAAAQRVYTQLKKPGQPVFLMVLTLNQHGPHNDAPMSKLPKAFRNLLRGLKGEVALDFDTYLARLQASSRAMAALEHGFLDRDQPTVLLHFGDHQPAFDGRIRVLARKLPPALEPYRDFLTYYMVKSNFAGPPLPSYPMLDIGYLPTLVIQAAGLPANAYFAAATRLRDRCDGRYTDCPDKHLLAAYYGWVFGRLHVYE